VEAQAVRVEDRAVTLAAVAEEPQQPEVQVAPVGAEVVVGAVAVEAEVAEAPEAEVSSA
jgi:hypothetical protein